MKENIKSQSFEQALEAMAGNYLDKVQAQFEQRAYEAYKASAPQSNISFAEFQNTALKDEESMLGILDDEDFGNWKTFIG